MAKRKRSRDHAGHRPSQRNAAVQGFYTPFGSLDQHLKSISRSAERSKARFSRAEETQKEPVPREEDERLFREAMAGVVPFSPGGRTRIPPAPPTKVPPRFLVQEELEVHTHLVDLVTGDGPFELSYSDEYIDGAVAGLSPEILKKLRKGDFSYQNYIDLHGYNRQQAREIVNRFVIRSFAQKNRCILIVSGRGLNSKDKEPVLKHSLVTWLTRAPLKRLVLAFASARSWDGGAGAFYVLLRRNEGKAHFVMPAL